MLGDEGLDAKHDESARSGTRVAHVARVTNYWMGGRSNFAADRQLARELMAADPEVVASVRSNRAFLRRVVRYLAADVGIDQFLDVGTGIHTAGNTHELAQRIAPAARIVYVDNDPIVLAHARVRLASDSPGATACIEADLRHTEVILHESAGILDFMRPMALLLSGILDCIPDADDPRAIVATLAAALPAGSYLVISHPASDIHPDSMAKGAALMSRALMRDVTFRSRGDVLRLFGGLDLLDPGLVPVNQWRPGPGGGSQKALPIWVGVARKP
jgi:hypothetical protein